MSRGLGDVYKRQILKNLLINSAEAAFAKDSIKEQLKRKIYEELDGVTYE